MITIKALATVCLIKEGTFSDQIYIYPFTSSRLPVRNDGVYVHQVKGCQSYPTCAN